MELIKGDGSYQLRSISITVNDLVEVADGYFAKVTDVQWSGSSWVIITVTGGWSHGYAPDDVVSVLDEG